MVENVTGQDIDRLMADLASEDGLVRVRARKSLVASGEPAVGELVKALQSRHEWVRWEAAKALSQIGSPSATQVLIDGLEDKMFDIRWMSAEGLIAIGKGAIAPLLHQLLKSTDSYRLREGAHHVLHEIEDRNIREIIKPVISALENAAPTIEVPLAAEKALDALGHGGAHGKKP
jgi:HEAT repeat protein